jgi:hypothetical protein
VHKSGVKIVRKTSLTYSFGKIQKLNVARLNKFGFSKVPSCDTLCKSCYHISGRSVVILCSFYLKLRNYVITYGFFYRISMNTTKMKYIFADYWDTYLESFYVMLPHLVQRIGPYLL